MDPSCSLKELLENNEGLILLTGNYTNFFGKLFDWKKLDDLIPKNFKNDIKFRKTGKAGIFAGSLELVKDGKLKIKQKNLFEDIYIKETK